MSKETDSVCLVSNIISINYYYTVMNCWVMVSLRQQSILYLPTCNIMSLCPSRYKTTTTVLINPKFNVFTQHIHSHIQARSFISACPEYLSLVSQTANAMTW